MAIAAEVPCGALADRFSRRAALAASGLLQAAGYVLWITSPGFAGFAGGFVLWGVGGAFVTGALEALLYDGLASRGAEAHYRRVYGWVNAVELLSQLPVAAAATLLFSTGGYELVGWASVGCCLAAAAVATRLPDARPVPTRPDPESAKRSAGYLALLREGVAEAFSPAVVGAVVALAAVGGLDALEEYTPVLAQDWGVDTPAVPFVLLAIPLLGAAGASLGGRVGEVRPARLASLLVASVVAFAVAGLVHAPVGIVAVALAYGLYHVALVALDARLQRRIEGEGRATVTSVASLGVEISSILLFAAWAADPLVVAGGALTVAVGLPRLLRSDGDQTRFGRAGAPRPR